MKRAKERDSSETAAIKINRRKVCLLIIAIGISVLLLITMLGLLHLEKSNTRRYREENHARFDVNTQAFQEVLDSSDAWIDNLKTSIYALPYLETASAADFLADLKQPGVKLTFDESPFPTDKNGNKILGRLQGLIMASSSFSEGAIYNPQTGVAIACISDGHVSALCTEEEELCALLGISSLNTEEGALTEGRAAEHANAALYLTRVLDDGLVLLCGVTHEALNDLLMCDKEAIEVQKILPFLSDTWPLCRIGRAVIRASQSCRQSCNKSQCPACGCRSHHSCTHAPQFSRSFPAREWGSVLQRQGACGQCP